MFHFEDQLSRFAKLKYKNYRKYEFIDIQKQL